MSRAMLPASLPAPCNSSRRERVSRRLRHHLAIPPTIPADPLRLVVLMAASPSVAAAFRQSTPTALIYVNFGGVAVDQFRPPLALVSKGYSGETRPQTEGHDETVASQLRRCRRRGAHAHRRSRRRSGGQDRRRALGD